MKNKIVCLILALCMLCMLVPAMAEEQVKPGLDVVIVMDFTFSNFPGMKANCVDKDLKSLDAAAMLINMVDAEYSRVAVVPFTDRETMDVYMTAYNTEKNDNLWLNWVDVSDNATRKALCDSLYAVDMFGATEARIHQGYSDYEYAMELVQNLTENRESDNQLLVLVLGDGKANVGSMEKAIENAQAIRDNGAVVYCLQYGDHAKDTAFLSEIASPIEGALRTNVDPSDLKALYSGIFASMIGTETEVVFAENGSDSEVLFPIRVLHKTVSELNVVLKKADFEGDITVVDPNGNVADGVYSYTCDGTSMFVTDAAAAYDFVSLKIVDPDPGMWYIKANKAADVEPDRELSIDLLYKSDLSLTASVANADVEMDGTVQITANFVDADGNNSTDMTLYTGLQEDGTGIVAELNIYDANGSVVDTIVMDGDTENGCFTATVDTATAAYIDGEATEAQTFSFSVNAAGDRIECETGVAGEFTVEPKPVEEPVEETAAEGETAEGEVNEGEATEDEIAEGKTAEDESAKKDETAEGESSEENESSEDTESAEENETAEAETTQG